ncbi:MAG: F0F1 ATP synthase subunit B' [Pseudomonadota bacterium]
MLTAPLIRATTEATEAAEKVFPPLDPSTFSSQLIWLTITLGGLYLILSRIALPRIGEVIEERSDRIQRDLDEAQRLSAETEQAIASYEQALAEAKGKAQGIAQTTRDELSAEVEGERQRIEGQIEADAAAAEARVTAAKNEALAKVDDVATDTVQAIVGRLLGMDVSADEAKQAVSAARQT